MRYVCSAAATTVTLMFLSAAAAQAQTPGSGLTITNYQLVSEERVSRTESYVTYRADLMNTGASRNALTATVSSTVPWIKTVPGQTNLHFGPVPTGGQVPSIDSFTILVDRTFPFDFSRLQWSFVAPVANAGPNRTVTVGSTVALQGTGSTNPSGIGTLSYNWSFVSRPPGSNAQIADPANVITSFVVDEAGTYVVNLNVSNGAGTDSARVTINTRNSAPVANAGPAQTVSPGSLVTLNGSGSSDVDGDPLTYAWQLISVPQGSAAVLAGGNTVSPTFIADRTGTYIAQLIVSDGILTSTAATVTITTRNTPPVANAGPNQSVNVGSLVQLNGAGSTDVDRDPLTYKWSLITMPAGSSAALSSLTAVNPTFTADRPGTYVAQLIVNDGTVDSAPDTVTITTNALQAPTANAGPNQTVQRGATVTLQGSGTDPQNLPLTFAWSLTTKPAGSSAALSATSIPNPKFVADVAGTYVAQLIVNNGTRSSTPSTVTITTRNTTPVANPGQNQSVIVGNTVSLDGRGSTDADNDPLQYAWSFTSRPQGSSAVLNGANTSTPSFLADVAGTYVVQLIVNDGKAPSNPATVTITASSLVITLTPNPLNLTTTAALLTVSLSTPAGTGGQVVRLAVQDPSIAAVPETVTVPAGSTGVNVSVTPLASGTTLLTASAPGFRVGTATVNVTRPAVAVTLSSPTVGVTRTINGTVTLNQAAPAGGIAVNLSASPGGIVTLQPTTVNIAAGSTTGTFTVTGVKEGSATINASATGYATGSTPISVGLLGAIVLQSGLTVGIGQPTPIQVSLASAAPVGGVTITLSSGNTGILTVSPTVTIPQGATTPASQPLVTGVNFGSALITASSPGLTGDSETVNVGATLSFSPNNVIFGAGGTQNLTLNLSSAAPAGGLTVNISSNNPAVAAVPATVSIPQGQTSVTVPVKGLAAGSATITASSSAPNVNPGLATTTVVIFGSIGLPAGLSVGLGQSVPFPVSLSANAPAGGTTVTLVSDPRASLSATSLVIPAGSRVPAVQPQITANGLGNVTVSASAPGFGSANTTVQLSASLSFSPATLNVPVGSAQNLTLTLSGPAPAGGLAVSLSSGATNIATVPASVTIAQGQTSVSVPVTGVAVGSTTVRATNSAVIQALANVSVQTGGLIGLPANPTIAPGQTVAFPITLPAAAPQGGVTVTLTSTDTTKATITPASVQIAAGQTSPATQPQVRGVNFGSATITAAAAGYTSATRQVTVAASLSFTAGVLSLVPGATQNVALTLSAPAPAGGLQVTLASSAAGIASVPATVTIPAGSTTVQVPIQGVSPGSATITASSTAPNVTSATKGVLVQSFGSIGVPANLTLNLGQTAPLNITLPAAATAPVSVTLSSSDTTRVGVTPGSVTIAAGQTQPSVQPQVTGLRPGTATISLNASGYNAATVPVQVNGSISFTPNTLAISGTETRNLVLTLSGPAPAGGIPINLTSTNTGAATVPATVSFAQNATTVNVPVTGVAPGTTTIRASGQNLAQTTATVTVAAPRDIILPENVSTSPGASAPFPVSLARAATGTTIINLTSSDPTKATLSASSVTILTGQTQPAQQPRVNGIATGEVTITAQSAGLTTATTIVKVGLGLSFSPRDLNVTRGTTQPLTLNLSAPAPAGGLTINLTSSNTAIATVPSTVSFAAGATSVPVNVTGVANGSAIIRANASGMPEATANITVVNPGSINLPSNISVPLGGSVAFPISLASAAPAGGVQITLTSSDTGRLTISPATVTIPAGSTTPTTQPQVHGVNVGNPTVSASAPGYTTVSRIVPVTATITFVEPTLIINPNTTGLLRLRLSAGAPENWAEGIIINLSSTDPAIARVPATTRFLWDGSNPSTVNFLVTGVAPGTVQIKASGLNIPEVAATVTVAGPLAIATTSLPDATTNALYSHALSASGGIPPFTWAHTAGTLPTGLSFNTSTGTISGTPTVAVTNRSLTFRVTDSSNPARTATKTLTLSVVQSAPASIAATGGTPQTTKINTAFTGRLLATVRDANNNPVPNVTVTFTAPASGARATFAGGINTAVTNASGVATSAVVSANATVGSYTVTAAVAGVATPANFSLTNSVGDPASITATAGTPQSAGANTDFAVRLAATVKDAGGNPVPNVTVTFNAPSSGASGAFAGGDNTAVTNASGVATAEAFRANATLGTYNVTATVPGVSPAAAFSLTNTAGQPATIAATGGTPQNAKINTAFAGQLAATVRDSGGNPVSGVTVTFTAPAATGASLTFAGGANTAVTNASGVATSAVVTANDNIGSYTVTARVSGVTTPASFSLTNTTGDPATIVATGGTPQSRTINTAFAALVATVRDAGGNPVPNVTVTFTVPGSGASGSFAAGNTAVTNAQGIATSPTLTANSVTGAFNVTASAPGVQTPATFALTNTIGNPASVVVTGGSPQSARINEAFATRLIVTVRDSGNNPVPGVTVTYTAPASGAGGTFAGGANTAVTNASGVATPPVFTANGATGSYNVNASVAGVGTPATFNLTNTAGPAASVTMVSGSPQSAPVSTTYTNPLVVIVRDAGGNPVSGVTVTFSGPASGAGVSFVGGATAVTNSTGNASKQVTANATPGGAFTVEARVSGVTTPAAFSLTNTAGNVASIAATSGTPQSARIGEAFTNRLVATVRDASGNPVPNVTVTFNAPASGASGTFAGGVNTAVSNSTGVAASAIFTANNTIGSYVVTATAPGAASPAQFALTNTVGRPASIQATGGTPQTTPINTQFPNRFQATVRDSAGNPVPSATVTFNVPASGASGTFAGANSAATNSAGVATSGVFTANGIGGSYNVTATVNGVTPPATYALTNTVPTIGRITITGGTVGKGLQIPLTLTLPAPPVTNVTVTITSSSPTRLTITGRSSDAGVGSLVATITGGLTTATVFAQALDSTGTVTVTASAQGYDPGTSTITLTPGGFRVFGPNGAGVPSFSVSAGVPGTPLTVQSVRLNSNGSVAEVQPVKGGNPVTVSLDSSNDAVGTVSPTSVTFNPAVDTATAAFNAVATGTTTLRAEPPAGFIAPTDGSVTANVTPSGLVTPAATIGKNLQTTLRVLLNGAVPSSQLPVTVTSNDASKLLFSATPNGTGVPSLTLTVNAGVSGTPDFYAHALSDTGNVTYSATASGYGSSTGTITLAKSGFVLFGPFGMGVPFTTTVGAENVELSISSVLLDAGLNVVDFQPIRGNFSVNVGVNSSNPSVGVITPSSQVTFNGNEGTVFTAFDPVGGGTTVLSITTPGGFTTPAQGTTLNATVSVPGIQVTDQVTVGQNLQEFATALLGQAAPAGGVRLTLTSNSPNLQLAENGTAAGRNTIFLDIPAGQTFASFRIHSLASSGTATYTASAPGYSPRTATVNLRPSAVTISGPFGLGFDMTTRLGQGPQDVFVTTVVLDGATTRNPIGEQAVAGGRTAEVNLTNSNAAVGTIPASATVQQGTSTTTIQFVPLATGQTNLGIPAQPAGFTVPSRGTTLRVTVNP